MRWSAITANGRVHHAAELYLGFVNTHFDQHKYFKTNEDCKVSLNELVSIMSHHNMPVVEDLMK